MEFYLIFVECVLNCSAAWHCFVSFILFPVYSCSYFWPRLWLKAKKMARNLLELRANRIKSSTSKMNVEHIETTSTTLHTRPASLLVQSLVQCLFII